jgi:ABC-type metal ion transport system substrate-binding protein
VGAADSQAADQAGVRRPPAAAPVARGLDTNSDQDKDMPWVAKLVKAYPSDEVRKFVQTEFKGAVIAGF